MIFWLPPANSQTGQQRKQAGQMAASDQRQYSKSPLAIRGASTEEQIHRLGGWGGDWLGRDVCPVPTNPLVHSATSTPRLRSEFRQLKASCE